MFKIFMITAIAVLAIGWIAYGIYELKMRAEEKKHPRKASKQLQDSRTEVTDWARKMTSFKPPKRPPKADRDNSG